MGEVSSPLSTVEPAPVPVHRLEYAVAVAFPVVKVAMVDVVLVLEDASTVREAVLDLAMIRFVMVSSVVKEDDSCRHVSVATVYVLWGGCFVVFCVSLYILPKPS